MRLHKEFIDLLYKKRSAHVRELLGNEGLKIVSYPVDRPATKESSLNEFDRIFYTIGFLEKENLIKVIGSDSHVVPHLGDELKLRIKKKYDVNHLFFTQEWNEENYNKWIKITPGFFEFIDNGYKTEIQRREKIRFWLPISVAILSAILTAFFTAYLTSYFQNLNEEKNISCVHGREN